MSTATQQQAPVISTGFSSPLYIGTTPHPKIDFETGETTLWIGRYRSSIAGFVVQQILTQVALQKPVGRVGLILGNESPVALYQMLSEILTGKTTSVIPDVVTAWLSDRVSVRLLNPLQLQAPHRSIPKVFNQLIGEGCTQILLHPAAINGLFTNKRQALAEALTQQAADGDVHLHWIHASNASPPAALKKRATHYLTWERLKQHPKAASRFLLNVPGEAAPIPFTRKSGCMQFSVGQIAERFVLNTDFKRL